MKHYTVQDGDTIWDIVNLMKQEKFTVFFPLGCYLRADGRFAIEEDHYDPEEEYEDDED